MAVPFSDQEQISHYEEELEESNGDDLQKHNGNNQRLWGTFRVPRTVPKSSPTLLHLLSATTLGGGNDNSPHFAGVGMEAERS